MNVDLVSRLAQRLEARPRRALTPDGRTPAAVLVPLLWIDEAPHVLYTRRSARLPHHRGQVAFPGGTFDDRQDADLVATAVREAHEEIGLAPADARLLGTLDDIETITSRFVITPVVAVVPHPYPWSPHPDEVDQIFTVALADLLAPNAERRETWEFDGRRVPIDHFPVAGQVIWGATHRITRNLLELVRSLF
jgi:8-oxo-dGTP pyrophosphatase MutT (NUDIX family)